MFTATVHIEHRLLALAPTIQSLDDVQIRVVTQVNTDPGVTDFPFLIKYDDRSELERALQTDPTVEEYKFVDWTDGAGIYYIEHTPETQLISSVVTEVNGFLIHTESKGGGWLVRMLLPDRGALNTIWEYATERDITLDIIDIYGGSDAGGELSYGLTDEQRTALQLAYERGYFSEPRDVSLEEIAAEMDLSSTAMNGRMRRGMRNLIAATIADTSDGDG